MLKSIGVYDGGGIYGIKGRNVVCTVYDTGDFSIRRDPRVAQKVRTSVDVIFLLGYDERGQQKKRKKKLDTWQSSRVRCFVDDAVEQTRARALVREKAASSKSKLQMYIVRRVRP